MDGTLWVVYEVRDPGAGQTSSQVVTARFEDGEWLREVLAVTSTDEPLRPEIHSRAGHLWVDWIDAPGQVRWLRKASGDGWGAIGSVAYSTELERDFFARGTIQRLAVE